MAFVYLRRDGYTNDSTPKIRAELEKALTLAPDFAPAYAFLSVAYVREPEKDKDKALQDAIRAARLEPGNLAYYIDVGKALLAAGRIPEATQISDKAKKLATTPNDRAMVTAFAKQVDYKVNHPEEASGSKPAGSATADDVSPAEDAGKIQHAEGQITEILCGHPPEVLLTLTTLSNSLLLHVTDITKLTIQEGSKPSDAVQSPCSKWKDRHAAVEFRNVASGMAKGEVQNISLN
jgi:hypothetical protein